MSELSPLQTDLRRQIITRNVEEAHALTARLHADAGPVFEILSKHESSKVRLLVLELIPEAPSLSSSRAVLALLADSNQTVHAVAAGMLTACTQREIVPDLEKLLEQKQDPEVAVSLIRQIGIAGDQNSIRKLARFKQDPDPEIAHAARAAIARLGGASERSEIVTALSAVDRQERVQALRDCQYIGDKTLVRHFGPVLDDRSDFMVITPPHVEPVEVARVCDIAVQTMAYMGLRFSFSAEILKRRTPEEIAEAKHVAGISQ
jgi:HEAT repeat protein